MGRYEELGTAIKSYMRVHGIKTLKLATQVYPELEFTSAVSAQNHIYILRRSGNIYGNSPFYVRSEKNLKRTAIILLAMNVPSDDPLIQMIKEIDSRFTYPPQRGQDNARDIGEAISLEEAMERQS